MHAGAHSEVAQVRLGISGAPKSMPAVLRYSPARSHAASGQIVTSPRTFPTEFTKDRPQLRYIMRFERVGARTA